MTSLLFLLCATLPGSAAEIAIPAVEPLPHALAAPYVQAEAALKAEAGAAAQPLAEAIAAKAEQLVGEQAQAALATGSADERARLQALSTEYARWEGSRHLAKVIAEAMDAATPEPETAVDAQALAEVRRELKERTMVPPSVVQTHLARVYGAATESGRAVHSSFIEPLRDPRSKRMMLALLAFASEQPRLLRNLDYAQARELLVAAANDLSERFDPDGPRGLPAALGAFSAQLGAGREQSSEAAVPAAESEPAAPSIRQRPAVPGASIDYFPGWPELDGLYGSLLRSGKMKLAKESDPLRSNEEVYTIYLGPVEAGRLTIRYHAGRVERNVLFMMGGRMSTQGRVDSPFDDAIRRFKQQANRLARRFRR